jgi:Domain of unknown function DUF120
MDIEVHGQVTSGQGTTTAEILNLEKELLAIVGKSFFPGSLNVILKHPLMLRNETGTRLSFDDLERRSIWRASLNGLDVWIYRWRSAPLHILEIICEVNLRKRFNLQDGDRVSLRINDRQIEKISRLSRFVWAAIWMGRPQRSYTNNEYLLFMEFGAAQQQPIMQKPVRAILWTIKQIVKGIPLFGLAARSIKTRSRGGGLSP